MTDNVIQLHPDTDAEEHQAHTSYEIALDSDQEKSTPVDTPKGNSAIPDSGAIHPVIPAHLQSVAGVKKAISKHCQRGRHFVAFHAVRSPAYLAKTVTWSAVGILRVIAAQLSWWWQPESLFLASSAVADNNTREYLSVTRHMREVRLIRGIALLAEVVAVLIVSLIITGYAPWAWPLIWIAAVLFFAQMGKPAGTSLVSHHQTRPRFRVINSDIVIRAYAVAGLCNPEKDQPVTFATPMSRDAANLGSQVVIDLPWNGKGFEDVTRSKSAIASGLDVSPTQVYVTKDKSSNRRHGLYVADVDPLSLPAGRTPLLDLKPRSIWQPAPFGVSERGAKVCIPLVFQSMSVASQPRVGKTFSTRQLVLFAALDPTARISVIDGKASPDWIPLKPVCHHFIRGTHPGIDGDPVQQTIKALSEIKKHIQSVNDFLTTLPQSECGEGKISEELCKKYPHQLFTWLLTMEEYQCYFETDSQDDNKEIAGLLSYILAVGPSAGVIVLSSSQKPSGVGAGDIGRLFNRYRDNHQTRFALRCGSRDVSIAALGGDAYQAGYDASALPMGPEYKGVGILYGLTDETPYVRCYLADGNDSERIVKAARKYREAIGNVTGFAAGESLGLDDSDIVLDIASVFLPGEAGLHWPVVAERLAERYPDRHADATADSTSSSARARGVPSKVVTSNGTRARGCRADDLTTATATP